MYPVPAGADAVLFRSEGHQAAMLMQPSGSPSQFRRRSQLYDQWASMLGAGVPMLRSLTVLAQSAGYRRHRHVLRRMHDAIERGATLGDALEHAQHWLPRLDRAVLSVGERTGRLEAVLALLAESSRQHATMLRDIRSGAVYPVLVLHVALLVFPISLIQDMVIDGQYMAFLLHKARVFGILYAAAFFLLRVAPRLLGGGFKATAESLVRPVPGLGRALRELALARVAFALDAQLSSGIGVVEAWMLAGEVCGSPALHREIRSWQRPLAAGATPGELVGRSRAFRGAFAELYRTGEMSGRLQDALPRIHHHYEDLGRTRMKVFAEWTPRLLYFGIILYVAYAVMSFWLGYFGSLDSFL